MAYPQLNAHIDDRAKATMLPPLPVSLSDNKLKIALNWIPIVTTSGILPIVGYFALHYGTSVKTIIILSIFLSLTGAISLFSFLQRSWSLFTDKHQSRPLGVTNRFAFDLFNWNFLFGLVVLTVVISVGISTENLRLVSLPLSILLLYVGL